MAAQIAQPPLIGSRGAAQAVAALAYAAPRGSRVVVVVGIRRSAGVRLLLLLARLPDVTQPFLSTTP